MKLRKFNKRDIVHVPIISIYLFCFFLVLIFLIFNGTSNLEDVNIGIKALYYLGVSFFFIWMILDLIFPHEVYANRLKVILHHILTIFFLGLAVFFYKVHILVILLILIQDIYPLFFRKWFEENRYLLIIDLASRFVGFGFFINILINMNIPLYGYLLIIFLFYNNVLDFSFYHFKYFRSIVIDRKLDPLIGVYNMTGYELYIDYINSYAKRYELIFSVLILELGNYHRINHQHGQIVADLLLLEVIKRIQKQLRKSDLIFRMKHDKFIIILSKFSDSDDINIVIEKLIEILKYPFYIKEKTIRISTSIGAIVVSHNQDLDTSELLQKAEIALNKAKNSGKEMCVVHEKK